MLAASYNNRAVLNGPKMETHSINKRVNSDQNENILGMMMRNFNMACHVFPKCYEAQFNRLLLQWK